MAYSSRIRSEENMARTSEPRAAPAALAAGFASDGPVVLYDGVCGLCDRWVQFVLARDRRGQFRFAPLQGTFAAAVLARHRLRSTGDPDTIILVEGAGTSGERLRIRSDAVLSVVARLGGAWRAVALFRAFPRFFRDKLYDLVAHLRYRIFGRLDSCAVPSGGTASTRFLP